jgi:DNA primase
MSSHPWVDFRAVKERVTMEAVLGLYGVDWLKKSGRGQLRGRCPIHQRGGEDAFHVSLAKNAFQCFYCQAHGNVLDFVAAMEKCSVRQAALKLQERFGVSGPGRPAQSRERKLVPEKGGGNQPLGFVLRGVDPSHPYLAQRGMEPATAQAFGVGFFAGRGMMSGRVVIPIHDQRGRLVAYCGRSLDGTTPRYKLPAGFRKSLTLFNLHRAAACGEDRVVVVEGFFDCMKVHQAGFPCVVALMGATLSEQQEGWLLERFRRVVLLLDGDQAGRRGSAAIAARLAGQCSVKVLDLPPGEQPDRLSSEQIGQLLKQELKI